MIEVEPIPDGPRRRSKASTQLLHEWCQIHFPGADIRYELRLGATVKAAPGIVLTPAIEAMLRRSNRYADAVIITPDMIRLVESKMEASAGALGQLDEYYRLAPFTPDLAAFMDRPIRMVLVVAVGDDHVRQIATERGIEEIVFTPTWAADWINAKYGNKRGINQRNEPIDDDVA